MTEENLGLPHIEAPAGGLARLLSARARRGRPSHTRPLWTALATTALLALAIWPLVRPAPYSDFSAQLQQAMQAPAGLNIEVEGGAALVLPVTRDDVQIVLVMRAPGRESE